MDQLNPEKVDRGRVSGKIFFGHIQLLEVFICVMLKEPYSMTYFVEDEQTGHNKCLILSIDKSLSQENPCSCF